LRLDTKISDSISGYASFRVIHDGDMHVAPAVEHIGQGFLCSSTSFTF